MNKFLSILAVSIMLSVVFTGVILGLVGIPLNQSTIGLYALLFVSWMIAFQARSSRILRPKSFTELEQQEKVSFNELYATLEVYAYSGAAIKGSVVIEIIDRTPLTKRQKERLMDLAIDGEEQHERMGEDREVAEYAQVTNHLADLLNQHQSVSRSA